ncbi:MAG: class GN sortase [Acidobacteriota bacterium]
MSPSRHRAPFVVLVIIASGLIVHGAWIPLKADVAQMLLRRAWQRTLDGEPTSAPWPWADTWPVARLRVPEHGVEQIVLEGASGAVLAFGPGRLPSTHRGGDDPIAVAGHRDTHFAFLRDLRAGDVLEWSAAGGRLRHYRVLWSRIVDRAEIDILDAPDGSLSLITCWPFDAVAPGGHQRFVVRARAIESPRQDVLDVAFFDEPSPDDEDFEPPSPEDEDFELASPPLLEPPSDDEASSFAPPLLFLPLSA